MFKWETLKSKMFWGGVLKVIGGAALISQGHAEAGSALCGLGLLAITGSDRLTKVLIALQPKKEG